MKNKQSLEHIKKRTETRKRNGWFKNRNKSIEKMKKSSWSKGLTKETDERVRAHSDLLKGVKKLPESNIKCSNTLKEKFKNGYIHNQKNKTYEEIYGEEKAKELRLMRKQSLKNKSWEKIMGEEKAKQRRENFSKNYSGKNNHMYGKKGINNQNYNSKRTNDTKRKMRESALERIEKFGGPSKGEHEDFILDELEKLYNYKIDRNFRIIGYKVDGYIHELNLCIEVDEPHHFDVNGNLRKEDIIRQKRIEQELNCKFLRIEDRF